VKHRIGWLRTAVLGASDGIVSTASLIGGVAAAEATRHEVLVASVAGLVAGALSMAPPANTYPSALRPIPSGRISHSKDASWRYSRKPKRGNPAMYVRASSRPLPRSHGRAQQLCSERPSAESPSAVHRLEYEGNERGGFSLKLSGPGDRRRSPAAFRLSEIALQRSPAAGEGATQPANPSATRRSSRPFCK
jgi:hypothetical protein